MDPTGLSRYLSSVGGFPATAGPLTLLDIATNLLSRGIREVEVFKGGRWHASAFWGSRALLLVPHSDSEILASMPDIVVVSAFYESQFSAKMKACGMTSTIHPFVYNPEWVECFVLKV